MPTGSPNSWGVRAHFEFRPFADELKAVDRRELADVKSDLLLAVLPRIPELAIVAKKTRAANERTGLYSQPKRQLVALWPTNQRVTVPAGRGQIELRRYSRP